MFILVFILTLGAALASPASAQTVIPIDPAVHYQAWQGWGTSLAWWAKVVGTFPEPARTEYLTLAFDPVKGLGLNVVRYNIGGGENPQYFAPHSQFLTLRSAVPGFEPSLGHWDWSSDAEQRDVLQRAIAMGANQLEAFSNSPPYWMTQSGSVTGNQGGADNLKPGFTDAFADYLATVVRHYHDVWGITFRDLEPLNEPNGPWTFGNWQEGCHVSRPVQNRVIQRTTAALRRQGLGTSVTASDEPSIGEAVATFQSYTPETIAGLTKINTHSYGGGDRTQLSAWALSMGKDLWLSEYGDNDAGGLTMSRTILADIRGLHPSAWVYWQFVDGAEGWGFLRNPLDNRAQTAYTINKKFYVMGQYSRYIRPGAHFVAIADPHSVASLDPNAHTLTLVTTNSGDAPMTVCYDLHKFTRLRHFAFARQTSPTENLVALPVLRVAGRMLTAILPPRSVTTFVVPGVCYNGRQAVDPRAFYRLFGLGAHLAVSADSVDNNTAVTLALPGRGFGQQWAVIGQGDGTFTFINRRSGLALDGGGADLIQTHEKEDDSRHWRLQDRSGGTLWIVNSKTGHPLTTANISSLTWRLQKVTH